MNIVSWYLAGALLHVLFRWSGWKSNNKDAPWLFYWRKHLASNIQSLILAVLCMFLWTQPDLLNVAIENIPGVDLELPEIERTPYSSLAAGFILETLGARLAARFGYRGRHGSN